MIGDGHVRIVRTEPETNVLLPICAVGECSDEAKYLMPQIRLLGGTLVPPTNDVESWDYIVVCAMHHEGWWDGDSADYVNYPVKVDGYALVEVVS